MLEQIMFDEEIFISESIDLDALEQELRKVEESTFLKNFLCEEEIYIDFSAL